jgi:transketolase
MEQMRNHSGSNSMTVLRPADSAETTVSWKLALENKTSPTALLLSRQNITDLPASEGSRYEDALKTAQGAYIVADCQGAPDVILLASGSEVATLIGGAELLRKDDIKIRIVSAPSEGLFRNQPVEYQLTVIPDGVPVFGLTAGLPVTLQGLAGPLGKVYGVPGFGYSAPYKVLDEKFGFTSENVYRQVKEYLASFNQKQG